MLGAIFGDIVGSSYEFNNVKTTDFPLFTVDSFATDDSVMTLALAEALMKSDIRADIDNFKRIFVACMHDYGDRYPTAGYGGNFAAWLTYHDTEPYGSYGNGSAMRVSPVAWYAESLEEAIRFAAASSEVTHDHPEGIKGAVCTSGAVYLARTGANKETIRRFVEGYYDIAFTLDEIRPSYTFKEICQDTVPQAMVAFLESESFEDCIRLAISIGGDSDNIAAMAGAVAEAYYGMSEEETEAIRRYLDEDQLHVLDCFRESFID
ncbi:MAG: ADP-ribosylglycohydrolase family protein [Clostridia bacterium]|nr:ADP-ribosylglycohydrolase family protein [Clostridia bacterium]